MKCGFRVSSEKAKRKGKGPVVQQPRLGQKQRNGRIDELSSGPVFCLGQRKLIGHEKLNIFVEAVFAAFLKAVNLGEETPDYIGIVDDVNRVRHKRRTAEE